jgi:hypothetical protein
VADVRPDLATETTEEIGSLLHALSSAPVFDRLTAQDGLDVDAAGALIGWVITLIREALNDHNDPQLPGPPN